MSVTNTKNGKFSFCMHRWHRAFDLLVVSEVTRLVLLPNNTVLCFCPLPFFSVLVVNCSDPGIPANSIRQSKIEHGNFTFGTVVFYDCNPSYYLFGSPVLTCQPTSQWDKPLPECIGMFLAYFNENLAVALWC